MVVHGRSGPGNRLAVTPGMRKPPRVRNRLKLSVLAALALVAAGSTTAVSLSLISVRQEVEIGQQAQAQVRAQTPEVRDAAVTNYVRSLGRRLAAQADGPQYPYSFSVANYREINAFALPGGPVWVNRGAIEAAQNESQLAGVIAHEIAHIANRHAAEQLTKGLVANVGLGVLNVFLRGESGAGADVARVGAGMAANLTMLKFSRNDEREADEKGLVYMARAGYDPRSMAEFMRILRERQGRDPGSVQTFFSSHPAPGERFERLDSQAASLGGGRRDSAQFRQVKARLQRMGPAPSMRR
jgi:predicted Zn-dependent protease